MQNIDMGICARGRAIIQQWIEMVDDDLRLKFTEKDLEVPIGIEHSIPRS